MADINEKIPGILQAERAVGLVADQRWRAADEAWAVDGYRVRAALGVTGRRRGMTEAVLLVLLVGVLLGAVSLFGGTFAGRAAADDLPFRLHIVANSDSAADQAAKLAVRDAVVEYLTPIVAAAADNEAAEQLVLAELANLERLAAGICADMGYGCRAEVGSFDFPAKRYGSIMLPAGEYRALRLNLGAAAGHNWWCVIFPPLCFVDECGDLAAAELASDAELLGARRVVRLKIAEIFDRHA